jgi:hypothetical protein
MNLNYVLVEKHDINKLLTTSFIQFIEEVTWLFPIIVIANKKWKIQNLCRFQKVECNHTEKPTPLAFH